MALPGVSGLPAFHHVNATCARVHGTAVSIAGDGLLILGPSGAGKSGLAAQLLSFGATLVSDDLVEVDATGEGGLTIRKPHAGPSAIELRAFGIVPVPTAPAILKAAILLGANDTRLPEPHQIDVLGHAIPLFRHAYQFDLAAKLLLRPWAHTA